MDLQQEVKFLCSLFQQVQMWVSLPSVQWGFIAHVGTLCTVLICSAAFVPWIANKKKASQCYRKKELQTPPSPPLEFLWNDTTENCVKFVPIDMQMLQSFTASGRRWMHYHVCFAHKYVYYHSAPASSKMIAIDVQIGQAMQDKKKNMLMKYSLPFPCFWFFFSSAMHKARAEQDPSGYVRGRPIWFSPKVTAACFALRAVTAPIWWEQSLETCHSRDLSECEHLCQTWQPRHACETKGRPLRRSMVAKRSSLK